MVNAYLGGGGSYLNMGSYSRKYNLLSCKKMSKISDLSLDYFFKNDSKGINK